MSVEISLGSVVMEPTPQVLGELPLLLEAVPPPPSSSGWRARRAIAGPPKRVWGGGGGGLPGLASVLTV